MTSLFTILAQTKTGTVIEIIILLLVAGVIAYLTAFFYYKSVYTKKINALEAEKDQLNSKINRLNSDISDLEKQLEELKEKDKKEKN